MGDLNIQKKETGVKRFKVSLNDIGTGYNETW